jgi:hypothetical protein
VVDEAYELYKDDKGDIIWNGSEEEEPQYCYDVMREAFPDTYVEAPAISLALRLPPSESLEVLIPSIEIDLKLNVVF